MMPEGEDFSNYSFSLGASGSWRLAHCEHDPKQEGNTTAGELL